MKAWRYTVCYQFVSLMFLPEPVKTYWPVHSWTSFCPSGGFSRQAECLVNKAIWSSVHNFSIYRRFPQRKIDQHFWVFLRSSRVLEDHWEISQPRNRLARLVESGFPQDWVVAALVEVHDDPFRLDFDHTSCFHEFAIQLFGRSGVKAAQLLGQPAIAPIGQHGHGGVEIDVESHFTRQTIDVKEVHANPQPVLDAIAAGVAYDQCPCTLLGVVGQEQGRLLLSQARDRQLAQRALVPWELHRLLQVPDTLMTAVRRVDHRLAPLAGRECAQAAQDGGTTPPDGDKPDAALVQLRQLGIGDDLGIKVQPLGIDTSELLPKLDKLERLASLITPGEIRVGIADDLARVLWCEEAQHTGPSLATLGEIVPVQPGGIAPKRDWVKVKREGGGVRKQHRRHGADPA